MKVLLSFCFTALLAVVALSGCGSAGDGGSGITAPASSAKSITAFSLAGVTGTINETTKAISVTMPYGTNITALVATFTTTGTSVKVGSTVQTSGTTANDFTSPVSYTVTAADSSTATYTVTVTVTSGAVSLPKTGQTTSYAAGDDGDLEKGVAWPSPRFTVGTGAEADCVTDNLTGMMWVKSPDSTTRAWADALTYADGLSLCGHTDWRLPNINELESMVNAGQSNIATWLNTQGFSQVANSYWSSTTYANNTVRAKLVGMYAGFVFYDDKSGYYYVWPVRSGQSAAAADLPKTGQTTSYATGDDGSLQKGVAWPSPRFAVGTGAEADCVTDNLTGMMWVKSPDSTTRTWADTLTYADGLSLCGHTDWRLPNRKELRSLANYGQSNSATWLNTQGFSNVQAVFYWSSTTYASSTGSAWDVSMYDGSVDGDDKAVSYYVWPVRAGQ